jgi:hypothetical protein
MSKLIPPYYITRKNTVIQIGFATVFAYAFINIYKPFGSDEWYDVSWWVFTLASGVLVVSGMLVVLLSRLFMFWVKRVRKISVLYYALMVAGEIIFMAILYVLLERWVMEAVSPFAIHVYHAVQNTALILLIPYLISVLFFEWQEKKMTLEKLVKQISHKAPFISLKDEKGILRLTLKVNDLIFLESSDNYVVIHYESSGKPKTYLIRNTLKHFEKDLAEFPLLRCHRSFMVNINHVKMMKHEKGFVQLLMDDIEQHAIHVSKSYFDSVSKILSSNIMVVFDKV